MGHDDISNALLTLTLSSSSYLHTHFGFPSPVHSQLDRLLPFKCESLFRAIKNKGCAPDFLRSVRYLGLAH